MIPKESLRMKSPVAQMCHRCSQLNLDEIFRRDDLQIRPEGVPLVDINGLSRNCRRACCDVCRFLASSTSLLDRAILADTWHLRAFDYDTLRFGSTNNGEISTGSLAVTLVPGSVNDPWPEGFDVASSHCILPTRRQTLHEQPHSYHGRSISRSMDFAHVRSWIDTCLRTHEQCFQQTRLRAPSDLRVIDCNTTEVVVLQGDDYVALSYCIGPDPHKSKVNRPSKGIRRFPKVVADAVRCCRGLGYQYLWVDQICIDQANTTALADAISKMHQIYSASALTIVSLGSTQDSGLAGISSTHRSAQASLRTKTATYVSTMASLSQAIHTSKWMTRAWCYQEAVLSRRLLFLGSDQTYFICSTSARQGSIEQELQHSINAGGEQEKLATPYSLELQKGPRDHGTWSFGKWVETYTTRDLSFQSDALNAFRGVLNISTHHTYWGIPLISGDSLGIGPNQARAFAIGLSWATTYNRDREIYAWSEHGIPTDDASYRREEFPSWSWAACRAFRSPITYKVPGDFNYEFESELDTNVNVTDIVIDLEDVDGSLVPIGDAVRSWGTTPLVIPEKSKCIEIETQTFWLQFSRVQSNGQSVVEDPGFGRFYVRISDDPDLDVAPDDSRFFVDFDRPPTVSDKYCDKVRQQRYLGLVLFFREDAPACEDVDEYLGGSHCILVCQSHQSGEFYERIGLVWVDDEHLELFERKLQRIRLK